MLRVFSFAVLMTGVGFAAYDGVQWLQTAQWQPVTINGVLAGWPAARSWIAHPHAWLGLHRVVVWTLRLPVFLVVTLLGVALLIMTTPVTPPHLSSERDYW
jgi:hypothetical protein